MQCTLSVRTCAPAQITWQRIVQSGSIDDAIKLNDVLGRRSVSTQPLAKADSTCRQDQPLQCTGTWSGVTATFGPDVLPGGRPDSSAPAVAQAKRVCSCEGAPYTAEQLASEAALIPSYLMEALKSMRPQKCIFKLLQLKCSGQCHGRLGGKVQEMSGM